MYKITQASKKYIHVINLPLSPFKAKKIVTKFCLCFLIFWAIYGKLSSFLLGHRPPPARSGHRCVADNTNLYVFGGYNPDYDESGGPDNEDYPLFRELWRYHFATGVWHQMGTDGYMPRELASMSRECKQF